MTSKTDLFPTLLSLSEAGVTIVVAADEQNGAAPQRRLDEEESNVQFDVR
jgi:hypothetical protein